MKVLSPVVWHEGMHLAQHHFQTQSRYFEELTGFALERLFFSPYGLIRCELDAEALLNGTVAVKHARGIMPDGLPFHFPEETPPAPLQIAQLFSPVHEAQRVLLAIAPYRPGRPNCALNHGAAPDGLRFVSAEQQFADDVIGADEKPINVARKNFRLMLEGQDTGDLVVLPIARIRRDGRGSYAYDPDYIPPCVQLGGSVRLLEFTGRLVELLEARAEALQRERLASQRGLAEWASREIANFWLTHALNSAAAPLRHLRRNRAAHPERLYVEVARLGGALCTFSLDASPRDLPAYDHDDLTTCFDRLERHIRRQLEVVVPANTQVIALSPGEPFFYRATVTDARCLAPDAHWYLGVRSSASRADLSNAVPRLVKVCSGEHIVRLVKEGLPGLVLEHEATPPSALSQRLGWHYFHLMTGATVGCWPLIVKTEQVGVYVPAAIPDAEIEFNIVLET